MRGLEGKIRGFSDSDRETVVDTVMKRLKAIKAGIRKGIRASALLNEILDGSWPTAVPEAEQITIEEGARTENHSEVTIQKPRATLSISDVMTAVLNQMTTLTSTV